MALKNGAGLAHSYANRVNALPPLRLVIQVKDANGGTKFETEPDAVAEWYAEPWMREWACGDTSMHEQEVRAMRLCRDESLEEADQYAAGKDWSPKAIRRACATFPVRTAIGSDDISFDDVATLPDAALKQLALIMQDAVANVSLPAQALFNVMAALGKKVGGCRVVAIMSTFYRLLMRVIGDDITQWDAATAGHWDSAVKGASALKAHLARALEVELASIEKLFCAHFFVGLQKVFRFRTHQQGFR